MFQCSGPYHSLNEMNDCLAFRAFILEIKPFYIPCKSGCVSQDWKRSDLPFAETVGIYADVYVEFWGPLALYSRSSLTQSGRNGAELNWT